MHMIRHRRSINEEDSKTIDAKKLKRKREKELEKDIKEVEDILIQDELKEIASDLGYDFIGGQTSGSFSLSDLVEVYVRYSDTEIQKIEVRILSSNPRFNCMRNTTDVEELAVQLQTATLIVKNVKQRLM